MRSHCGASQSSLLSCVYSCLRSEQGNLLTESSPLLKNITLFGLSSKRVNHTASEAPGLKLDILLLCTLLDRQPHNNEKKKK